MAASLGSVVSALGRGVASQLTPRMLALLVLPFLVAIAFWILSAWFLWDPVTGWFQAVVFQGDGWMARGYRAVAPYGLGGLSTWIPNLFAFLLLVPIAIATALALIAVLAMPMVVRHLGTGGYADVDRRGSLCARRQPLERAAQPRRLRGRLPGDDAALADTAAGAGRALALVGLAHGAPDALRQPGRARNDARARDGSSAPTAAATSLLGLAVALLNYIPPLFLVAPVLSALVFAHYSLSRLREQRTLGAPASRRGDWRHRQMTREDALAWRQR